MVVQSFRSGGAPPWIAACLDSVRTWAERRHHAYAFFGDEILERVPSWYLDKVGDRLPIAVDYARLALMHELLEAGRADRVIWMDADVLVFDPALALSFDGTCAFGQECWVQEETLPGKGPDATGQPGAWPRRACRRGLRATRNVHNAVCVFTPGCPVLPFLMQTTLSIMGRVEPGRIAPQLVGPKLLSALHNIAGFPLLPQAGALSPLVLADIARGGGPALDLLRARTPVPLQAANLCASVAGDAHAQRTVEVLLDKRALP